MLALRSQSRAAWGIPWIPASGSGPVALSTVSVMNRCGARSSPVRGNSSSPAVGISGLRPPTYCRKRFYFVWIGISCCDAKQDTCPSAFSTPWNLQKSDARLYCPAIFVFSSGHEYINLSTFTLHYPKHLPAGPPISSPFDSAQERPPPGGRTCPAGRSSRRGSPGRAPAPPPPPGYPPPRAARAVPCGGVCVCARA